MGNKCSGKISKNFVRDCSYSPKSGLHTTIYLVNTEEIDRQATQFNESKTQITNLVLKSGAKLYKMEGGGKYPQGKVTLKKGDFGNNWTHSLSVRLMYYGVEERAELNSLIRDGRVTAIVKRKDTGINGELTYAVLGFETGMAVQTSEWSSVDNNGTKPIDFATEEGEEEAMDDRILMMTDLATTEQFIEDNLSA